MKLYPNITHDTKDRARVQGEGTAAALSMRLFISTRVPALHLNGERNGVVAGSMYKKQPVQFA